MVIRINTLELIPVLRRFYSADLDLASIVHEDVEVAKTQWPLYPTHLGLAYTSFSRRAKRAKEASEREKQREEKGWRRTYTPMMNTNAIRIRVKTNTAISLDFRPLATPFPAAAFDGRVEGGDPAVVGAFFERWCGFVED